MGVEIYPLPKEVSMGKFIDLTGQRFGRLTAFCREDFVKKDGKKRNRLFVQMRLWGC